MKNWAGLILTATLLAGCGQGAFAVKQNKPSFDGQYFRTSSKSVNKRDRADFVVSVRGASRSLAGAALAARHEATAYCIKYFGTSDISWPVDPMGDGASLPVTGDRLQLSATCIE